MLGIYGGTFNPIHYGHLRAAIEIKEYFSLEQIRFIPCYQPVHKHTDIANADMRWHMLKLALKDISGMVADKRELQRQGNSYMLDTLISLKQDFPQQKLLLIIGTDAFLQLSSWYKWQQLFDYAHILVMQRPNIPLTPVSEFLQTRICNNIATFNAQQCGKIFFQNITQLDISASLIRTQHAAGKNIRFLLPDQIINYIQTQQLYRNLHANR